MARHTRLLLEDTGSRRASPHHKRLPSNISVSSSSLAAKPSFLLQEHRGGQPPLGTTSSHEASEPGKAIWMPRAWLHPCHGQKPSVGAGAWGMRRGQLHERLIPPPTWRRRKRAAAASPPRAPSVWLPPVACSCRRVSEQQLCNTPALLGDSGTCLGKQSQRGLGGRAVQVSPNIWGKKQENKCFRTHGCCCQTPKMCPFPARWQDRGGSIPVGQR